MGMENEPPRRQERQELIFSMKRENKIMQLAVCATPRLKLHKNLMQVCDRPAFHQHSNLI
ncbi:MAG: hypothetical protein N2235_16700 [Fischerella sp.]|nr:hypothetical protein [Fischerella sp.]